MPLVRPPAKRWAFSSTALKCLESFHLLSPPAERARTHTVANLTPFAGPPWLADGVMEKDQPSS